MVKTVTIIAAVIAVAGIAFSLSGGRAVGDASLSGCAAMVCAAEKAPAAAACCEACPCDGCACTCDDCACECVCCCTDCACEACDCANAECPCCATCDDKPAGKCGPKHGC